MSDVVHSVWCDNDICKVGLDFYDDKVFAHIDVHKWSKANLDIIRMLLDELCEQLNERGVELLFLYTNNEKTMKFANLVRPLDYNMEKSGIKVGAWETDIANGIS